MIRNLNTDLFIWSKKSFRPKEGLVQQRIAFIVDFRFTKDYFVLFC